MNVCPSSVLINSRGAWKLAGFDFCVLGLADPQGLSFSVPPWDRSLMGVMSPALDFAAPELVDGAKCSPATDMFSLGQLGLALFNDCKPVMSCRETAESYRTNLTKVSLLLRSPPLSWEASTGCPGSRASRRPSRRS